MADVIATRARRGPGAGRALVRAVASGAALNVALVAAPAMGADPDLADLRLFVTPERRAELDGAAPPDGSPPGRSEGEVAILELDPRAPAPVADTSAAARRDAPPPSVGTDRPDAPPPGSATLRSSRGTSRIVDGLPERSGPS